VRDGGRIESGTALTLSGPGSGRSMCSTPRGAVGVSSSSEKVGSGSM